eukprot:1539106-Pyramimonas_sp.AAC.1
MSVPVSRPALRSSGEREIMCDRSSFAGPVLSDHLRYSLEGAFPARPSDDGRSPRQPWDAAGTRGIMGARTSQLRSYR